MIHKTMNLLPEQDITFSDSRIHEVIVYINAHLTESLDLQIISEHFFFSKYYLCKLFKQNTGFTIQQYISQKRLLLAIAKHKDGENWLSACLNAGFHDYSNFYRTYRKVYGTSPNS